MGNSTSGYEKVPYVPLILKALEIKKPIICLKTFFNSHIENGNQKTKVLNEYKNTSIFKKMCELLKPLYF